jgi:hypothetical protein
VYVALQTLPECVVRGVSAAHIAEVLKLEHDDRIHFLTVARDAKLSAKQLRKAIVTYRRGKGEKRGRRVAPITQKALRNLKRAISLAELGRAGLVATPSLEPRMQAEARVALTALKHAVEGLQALLEGASESAPPPPLSKTGAWSEVVRATA